MLEQLIDDDRYSEGLDRSIAVLGMHASSADRIRKLHSDVVDVLIERGVVRHFVPREFGGTQGSFSNLMQDIRALAMRCTSAAWCGAIYAVAARMAAYLPRHTQREIWRDGPDTPICASFRATGHAQPAAGGWVLSGQWHSLSGIDFAAWILVCIEPIGEERAPRFAAVPKSSQGIRVIDDWHTLGMRGTGSKSIELDDVFVPRDMTFLKSELWAGRSSHAPGPRYHVSPMAADPHLFVAAALGAAIAALGHWSAAFGDTPPTGEMGAAYARSAAEIDAAGLLVERGCEIADRGGLPPALASRNARDASLAAEMLLTAVSRLFKYGGSQMHFEHSALQRVWRDIQTLTSHVALRPDMNFEQYVRSAWTTDHIGHAELKTSRNAA
jgi:alkylation response protein AidB-like acyl-CoA dehydrogenase